MRRSVRWQLRRGDLVRCVRCVPRPATRPTRARAAQAAPSESGGDLAEIVGARGRRARERGVHAAGRAGAHIPAANSIGVPGRSRVPIAVGQRGAIVGAAVQSTHAAVALVVVGLVARHARALELALPRTFAIDFEAVAALKVSSAAARGPHLLRPGAAKGYPGRAVGKLAVLLDEPHRAFAKAGLSHETTDEEGGRRDS